MTFYLINSAVLMIQILLLRFTKWKKFFRLILFIQMFIVMGFRGYSVGTDTEIYYYSFGKASFMGNQNRFIYDALSRIVNRLGGEYNVFLVLIAFLSLISIFSAIREFDIKLMSSSIFLYISLYFYYSSFNISRQMLAVSLSFFGVVLLLNNKNRGVVLFAIAFFIHATAILNIFVYLILRINWTKKKFWFFIVSLTTLSFFSEQLINAFINRFDHYSIYLTAIEAENNFSISILLRLTVLLIGGLLGIITLLKTSKIVDNRQVFYRLSILYIVAIFVSVVSFNSLLLGRLVYYFSIIQIIYIPYCLNTLKINGFSKMYTIILRSAIYLISIMLLIYLLSANSGEIVPYSFNNL